MNAEDLERIQSKIAYLEQANAELGDEVYRQQQQIDALRERLRTLFERFDTMQAPDPLRPAEDERPPHY